MMTYEDSLSLKSSIESAILDLSGSPSLKEDFLSRHFEGGQLDVVIDHLKGAKVNQLSKDELLAGLKKLDGRLGRMRPVDLEVALEPDEKFMGAVYKWVVENIGDFVLPRYKVNPELVGGAKITYGGNFLDLSLRRKIDELPFFKRKI